MNYGGSHCEGYPRIISFLLNISLIRNDVNKQTAGKVLLYHSLSLYICLLLIEVSAASLWKFVDTQGGHFSNDFDWHFAALCKSACENVSQGTISCSVCTQKPHMNTVTLPHLLYEIHNKFPTQQGLFSSPVSLYLIIR